ncbi:MAG TPA: hemerythrin domain-containing protein [Mycobacteriales bacterium]|nr:hemerythrin domain-containing protein [Mycobacteriales bacterium]
MTDTTTARVPAQGTPPLADTSDMAQVHRVFRDAVAAAPSLIGSAVAGEHGRVDLVAAYYRNVLALLHAHHDGEDELIWPILIDRAPEQAAEVQRIAGQHADVDSALQAASAAIGEWQQTHSEVSGRAAAVAVTALGAALLPHLDEEEAVIVPLAAQHIFAPEWGELPGHALRNFSGDKMWLVLGLIREQMSPQQLAMMDDHMPPPLVAMWQQQEAEFGDFVSELRRPPVAPA